MTNRLIVIFSWVFIVSCSIFCGRTDEQESPEKILVTIGEKNISVDEFIRRTEFTLRPIFPGHTPDQLKKIYLNNLMIEKMFSLEAQRRNRHTEDASFQALIKGITEQAMREQLFYLEAFNKAKPDTNEIKEIYPLAGREYDVEFLVINDEELARHILSAKNASSDSLKMIFDKIQQAAGKTDKQTVKYRDPENLAIHEALFSEPLKPGSIIGPIWLENDVSMIMKIINWKYKPAISSENVQIRWNQVAEKMTQNKAAHLWREYCLKLMNGKSIRFEKTTANKIAGLFYEIKVKSANTQKMALSEPFRQNAENTFALDGINDMASIMDVPFFSIDGETWTVRDFRNELMSHPLVFRTQELTVKNFKEQFKHAIADLVRDRYLTNEALKKSLDQNYKVVRTREMWNDSYCAFKFRDELLAEAMKNGTVDGTDNLEKIKFLNGYIESLQKKYSDKIAINNNELMKIHVTDVNMFVTQPNMPIQVVVPDFPQFTSDYLPDYVKNFQN